MKELVLILISFILLESCSSCSGERPFKKQFSRVSTHNSFISIDSLNNKIELNANDTISYRDFFITWDPNLYFFSESKKQWNILNELIPAAYACDPPHPIPLDSIQNINIKSLNNWNSTIKADSSLNSIFQISSLFEKNTLLSWNEYKNKPVNGIINFYTSNPPDSIRSHIFIIDFSLKDGRQFVDTLKPVWINPS